MSSRNWRYYVGDFETTVYPGQTNTAVWASALVELYTDEVYIDSSIWDAFERIKKLTENCDIMIYYHNLKFDGEFWISYLNSIGYSQAFDGVNKKFLNYYSMPDKTYSYAVSDRGQWYKVTIKVGHRVIELRDSLKLLPFSVEKIGKSFGTKHKKTSIEYEGLRTPGGVITDEEQDYIKNDVLVVKEALEIMFDQGHKDLTIGACCLKEFKRTFMDRKEYESLFPNLYDISISKEYGSETAGDYILKSYSGGWCYLLEEKAGKILRGGLTADVNSLYPSSMHSDSGNMYPYGKPTFWKGDIPDKALGKFYFVRFRCRFYLKSGNLPFVHIRHNYLYRANDNLKTSDIYIPNVGYVDSIKLSDGSLVNTSAVLTMCKPEFELFMDVYDVKDYEVLDGCYFSQDVGFFDFYLDKYKKIKMNSEGAIRESAKLFSNNLYGKLAASMNSSFKEIYFGEQGEVKFTTHAEFNKTPGYIAAGSAITAYSRKFTITAAIKNYHGPDKPGFVYADTDSLHCDRTEETELIGVPTHPTEYNHWKIESHWNRGLFVRQKTYIEEIGGEFKVTCAGMPKICKDIFVKSLTRDISGMKEKYHEYILKGNNLADFKPGLSVPGKLYPRHITGGVLLYEDNFTMKGTPIREIKL